MRADAGQIDGRLDARVAASDNRDRTVLVERSVAMRTESDSTPRILPLARHVQASPAGARSDDQRRSHEPLAGRSRHALESVRYLDLRGPTVLEHLDRITAEMLREPTDQLATGRFGNGNQVLDTDRLVDLPADALGHEGHAQSFAGRVDRGRNAGGSAPEHNDVETALDSLDSRGIDPVAGLQLRKQLAEIAPSYVQQLAVGKNGRNALNVQRGHLGLMDRPVDRLVFYARIQRNHRIEGLHDIGTVRTRQRHIGRQADRTVQRPDPVADAPVGKVLALAVGIEHGQQQRRELMTGRHGPERDPGRLTVPQQRKAQPFARALAASDPVGARGYLAEQLDELATAFVLRRSFHIEHIIGLEAGENGADLLLEGCIQHGSIVLNRS